MATKDTNVHIGDVQFPPTSGDTENRQTTHSLSCALGQIAKRFRQNLGSAEGNGPTHSLAISVELRGGSGLMLPRRALSTYFPPPTTCKLFFTEKTLGTPLARTPATFLSLSLSTTPSSVTFPFFTMMCIDGTAANP